MSYELKPCPFCGGKTKDNGYIDTCPDCGIPCPQTWNTRPIEDELRSRIADLEQQLADQGVEGC